MDHNSFKEEMWKGGTGYKKVDHIINNLGYFSQIPPLTFGHKECKGHCEKKIDATF